VLLRLANLGRPRRPAGALAPHAEPVLADATTATEQLAGLIERPVAVAELADLRRLHRGAVDMAETILAGKTPDCAEINALAAGSTARLELILTDGVLRQQLTWTDQSVASALARRLVDELGALQTGRLRRCARPECDLLFYDTTKSGTRRWHAEDPCGWRQRQRVHRRRAAHHAS
jgi:predicted RNA-binding Zn ribbon-like protein